MKLTKVFLLIIICATFVSCSKATNGVAPGAAITAPSILDLSDTHMKYGSVVTTPSGWVINVDSADPIQTTTTANGWQVEIKYE